MRVLTYPHDLGIGGSQLNAIELSAALRDRGHEVLVYGRPGPLVEVVRSLGLEFLEAPEPGRRPAPAVIRDLARLVRLREVDVLHGYEWPPGLECHLAARLTGALSVTTVMSMAAAPFLPRSMSLVVGTEQIADAERRAGRDRVWTLEPPVDTVTNTPDPALGAAFRQEWGLAADDFVVVCVSRLAAQLKLEGLRSVVEAAARMSGDVALRVVIVGDGPARAALESQAAAVNARAGREVVTLTGEMSDPRAAYAAADVAIGMGGSALRAAAFEKPLVVQGEGGFFRLLTPESLPDFLWTGWYGYGPAPECEGIEELLRRLADDEPYREDLGGFSRKVVEQQFSLTEAAERQEAVYAAALRARGRDRSRPWTVLGRDAGAALRYATHQVRRQSAKAVGRQPSEDFNARPVAKGGAARSAPAGGIVYFAGAPWSAVSGTDKQLASELSREQTVIWVDPPMSGLSRRRRGLVEPSISRPMAGIVRVSTSCLPGVSRPFLRDLTRWQARRDAHRAIRRFGVVVSGIVVSDLEQRFPTWAAEAPRVYFETDDFVAGARLLGHSPRYARACRLRNVVDCDVVVAVTQSLADALKAEGKPAIVLPNGTHARHYADVERTALAPEVRLVPPVAGVVGQLNERLDVSSLEAVARTGSSLLLIGPRYERSPQVRERLDALIAMPNVQWIDRQPFERLPEFMATIDVGLTPYADNEFNRASFPLKTLEYLAAGRPVVSSDLPAARALSTDHVVLASTPEEFAIRTVALMTGPRDRELVAARQDLARQHSWSERARRLLEIMDVARAAGLQGGDV